MVVKFLEVMKFVMEDMLRSVVALSVHIAVELSVILSSTVMVLSVIIPDKAVMLSVRFCSKDIIAVRLLQVVPI